VKAPLPPRLGTGLAIGGLAALLARDLDLPTLASYWDDRAPLVVAGAAILAAAWAWAPRSRPLVAGGALLLGAVWLTVALTPLTAWMLRGLPRHDPEGPADAVFVLASSVQDDGELTTPAMSRLLHALELLGQGLAPRLVLSELPAPEHQPYAPVARALMAHLGLRQEVLTVGPVVNTHDEALALAALFRGQGWSRVLLVTSPTHSRRAAATFEAAGLRVLSSPAMETRFDIETLRSRDDRLQVFGALLHEYVGIRVYRWRGWIR
jgi:uncharacterized SAM-binding protein YcdF (DUF218 family)